MSNKEFEVFISRVVVDFDKEITTWVWYPTVQRSILTFENGKVRIVKSEKNYHTATYYIGDCYDNYEDAFKEAVEQLKKYKDKDFVTTEFNIIKQYEDYNPSDKYYDTVSKIRNLKKRKIVFEDLSRVKNEEI